MCDAWTPEQWLANSQPADPTSIYTLIDTRYNAEGEAARTYREEDGWFYVAIPGQYNAHTFAPTQENDPFIQADALCYLENRGYTLTEAPAAATV